MNKQGNLHTLNYGEYHGEEGLWKEESERLGQLMERPSLVGPFPWGCTGPTSQGGGGRGMGRGLIDCWGSPLLRYT